MEDGPHFRGGDNDESNFRHQEQIAPVGVHRHDHLDLPCAVPFLDALLAQDGFADVGVMFEPDEAMQSVAAGEAVGLALAVFDDAATQVIGDAGIQGAVWAIGQDIDVVIMDAHSSPLSRG